ncbi:STAS domain-containing protein [Spongiactinospora sp. 9N601]|uniref:STAS domain-containing protein n=1 Tax=Spongiactinospora sp. 9N601 TaxID=3375149 RepID=UPI00378EB3A6
MTGTGPPPGEVMDDDTLTIATAMDHGVLVVRPTGRLVWNTAAIWHSWLETLPQGRPDGPVLIDLAELAFLDATGVSCLINAHRHLTGPGTAVAFARPGARVTRWLQITGLPTLLPVFDTTEAALRSLLPPMVTP